MPGIIPTAAPVWRRLGRARHSSPLLLDGGLLPKAATAMILSHNCHLLPDGLR